MKVSKSEKSVVNKAGKKATPQDEWSRRGFLLSAAAGAVMTMLCKTIAASPFGASVAASDLKDASALASKRRELTLRPPLGWNSFDSYGIHIAEEEAFANLEAMARRLKPFGYEYFVIDGGWYNEYDLVPGTKNPLKRQPTDQNLDEHGLYVPSKTYFPNGLQALIDRAHALGLKFGIHIMRGIPRKAVKLNTPIQGTQYHAADVADINSICPWSTLNYGVDMRKPGAQSYYDAWIGMLARWGVDFIKADDITAYPAEIEAVSLAIERSRRPMVLSLSPGGDSDRKHLPVYRSTSNILRTTKDIWDNRLSLERAFAAWETWHDVGGYGFWPDLDMIPFGHLLVKFGTAAKNGQQAALMGQGRERMSLLTKDQQRTFITMRALAASPLFMGGDLTTTDEYSYSLITNREMLACNQNSVVGALAYRQNNIEVWRTPRGNNERRSDARKVEARKNEQSKGWLGIFNRNTAPQTVRLTKANLFADANKTYKLYDVWNNQKSAWNGNDSRAWEIGADGVVFLKYES